MLPFLFSALAPTIFTGMAPLVASSLGAGIGTLAQGGDPEDALLAGLGGYLGGTLMGGMGGAAGGAGAEAATNAALMPGQTTVPGASPGVNMTQGTPLFQSMPNATGAELLPSPEALAASKPQGLFGSMKGALGDMTSPQNIGVGVGATMGPSLLGGMNQPDSLPEKGKWTPEAKAPASGTRPTPAGYVPGRDAEHDYGVAPNVARWLPTWRETTCSPAPVDMLMVVSSDTPKVGLGEKTPLNIHGRIRASSSPPLVAMAHFRGFIRCSASSPPASRLPLPLRLTTNLRLA